MFSPVTLNQSRLWSKMTVSLLCDVLSTSATRFTPDLTAVPQPEALHPCYLFLIQILTYQIRLLAVLPDELLLMLQLSESMLLQLLFCLVLQQTHCGRIMVIIIVPIIISTSHLYTSIQLQSKTQKLPNYYPPITIITN